MKKIAIIAACALTCAAATAQLPKEVERAIKDAKTYSDYQNALKAAGTLSDAASNFTAGEGGFKVYDQYLLLQQVNQLPQDAEGLAKYKKDRASSLLDGYNYFKTAYPLDSLPDAKGKVKPKYSKKMNDIIVGHVNDFDQAAADFFNVGNYAGAYDCWDILLDVSNGGRFANIKPFEGNIVSSIRNNQGRAAFQMHDYDKAMKAFEKSFTASPNDTTAYEFAYESARMAENKPKMTEYALAGFKQFGASRPVFLQLAVNSYVDAGNYEAARDLLTQGIAEDPNNGAYYYSYGILNESLKNRDEAKANYKKAIELSNVAGAYYNLGRMLAEDYDALDQQAGNLSQAEYNKYAYETLRPILLESASNLEKAYELDKRLHSALTMLKTIYYRLNDEPNMKRIEELMLNAD